MHVPEAARIMPFVLLAGSTGLLGGALAFQHVGNLEPCVLCVYQRWPHAAVIVLSMLAAVAMHRPAWTVALQSAAAIALLAGVAVAGFHVGVEQSWWQGTAGCSVVGDADTIADLRRQLEAQPVASCDSVTWSLFGISMAGYNLLFSLALAALGLWSARMIAKSRLAR